MLKLLKNHVKTLLYKQFFPIFDLGNIFDNFDQKVPKNGKKVIFFFAFFSQNFQKYCLLEKFEKI